MRFKSLLKRYFAFILGLYFLSAGVVLIVRSALGTTPISSLNYVMSLHTPLTLGTWTFIINIFLIIGQFFLISGGHGKRIDVMNILLQIPFSFVFSAFIDFNMYATSELVPPNYASAFMLVLIGCAVQAVGVVLEIKPRVCMMSAEAFVFYLSQRLNKDFGKLKVKFDITLVSMAIIASLILSHKIEGIREATVIAACLTGHLVSFLSANIMTRRNLSRIRLIKA